MNTNGMIMMLCIVICLCGISFNLRYDMQKQTAVLEQIAANSKQPVAISLQDVSPEAVAVLAEANKPVAVKKGRK